MNFKFSGTDFFVILTANKLLQTPFYKSKKSDDKAGLRRCNEFLKSQQLSPDLQTAFISKSCNYSGDYPLFASFARVLFQTVGLVRDES